MSNAHTCIQLYKVLKFSVTLNFLYFSLETDPKYQSINSNILSTISFIFVYHLLRCIIGPSLLVEPATIKNLG